MQEHLLQNSIMTTTQLRIIKFTLLGFYYTLHLVMYTVILLLSHMHSRSGRILLFSFSQVYARGVLQLPWSFVVLEINTTKMQK